MIGAGVQARMTAPVRAIALPNDVLAVIQGFNHSVQASCPERVSRDGVPAANGTP